MEIIPTCFELHISSDRQAVASELSPKSFAFSFRHFIGFSHNCCWHHTGTVDRKIFVLKNFRVLNFRTFNFRPWQSVCIRTYTNCSLLKKFRTFNFRLLSSSRNFFNGENFPIYGKRQKKLNSAMNCIQSITVVRM